MLCYAVLECDWTANEKCPDEIWDDMKKVYLESAEKVLGKKVGIAIKRASYLIVGCSTYFKVFFLSFM